MNSSISYYGLETVIFIFKSCTVKWQMGSGELEIGHQSGAKEENKGWEVKYSIWDIKKCKQDKKMSKLNRILWRKEYWRMFAILCIDFIWSCEDYHIYLETL